MIPWFPPGVNPEAAARAARTRTIILIPKPESQPESKVIGEETSQTRRFPSPKTPKTPKSPKTNPEPEQFAPGTRLGAVPSPRTGCVVLFYRILCIFFYILCLMLDNVYIWCYVHHSRLSQTLKFRQFVSDLVFRLRC
jgi:hypothetical protein